MIAGLGHDVVAVDGFAALVADATGTNHFVHSTFSASERHYCDTIGLAGRAHHYAVRFAAKEAAIKALDAAAGELDLQPSAVALGDIEILRDARGRPSLCFHARAQLLFEALEIKRAQVSLSHDGNIASAVVVLSR